MKEEILKEWDSHNIFTKIHSELAIMAMTEYALQSQETLNTRILELESQIESLTNVLTSDVSCKENYSYDINDDELKWLVYYGKTKNNQHFIDELGRIDWALIECFRMLKTQTNYDAGKVEFILWKRIRSILNLNPQEKKLTNDQ